VLAPAVLEVNGLSDMSLQIELERIHSRAPIQAVTLAWWRKSGDEFRAAMQERNRSKVGRMARLRGHVEMAEVATPGAPSPPLPDKVQATVEFMRKSGATEADVEAFIQSQTA
jgi:hypothetical protein